MRDGGQSPTTYQERVVLELAAQEHARQAFRERVLIAVVFVVAALLIGVIIWAVNALWQSAPQILGG